MNSTLYQFLHLYQDDGRPENVEIKHDKNNHMVNIKTLLKYEENDHAKEKNLPHYIRH